VRALILAAAAASLLAACGVKPDDVSRPPGADPTAFPRTYPNPALDPLLSPPRREAPPR
jgi:hypothetical protein